MKKTKTMRAASFLLVLTLMTSCFVGSTFAKYTTTATGTDTARVAKWGVTITANGETFSDSYAKDDQSFTLNANTVVTSGAAGDAIVAPGTGGELAACEIEGTPEVAVKVEYVANLELTGWEINGTEYCPIVFSVGTTEYKIDTTNTDIDKLEEAVESAIGEYTAYYVANQDLSETSVATPAVSWAWPYSTSTDNDVNDTALGDLASAPAISLTITTSVTQIN